MGKGSPSAAGAPLRATRRGSIGRGGAPALRRAPAGQGTMAARQHARCRRPGGHSGGPTSGRLIDVSAPTSGRLRTNVLESTRAGDGARPQSPTQPGGSRPSPSLSLEAPGFREASPPTPRPRRQPRDRPRAGSRSERVTPVDPIIASDLPWRLASTGASLGLLPRRRMQFRIYALPDAAARKKHRSVCIVTRFARTGGRRASLSERSGNVSVATFERQKAVERRDVQTAASRSALAAHTKSLSVSPSILWVQISRRTRPQARWMSG